MRDFTVQTKLPRAKRVKSVLKAHVQKHKERQNSGLHFIHRIPLLFEKKKNLKFPAAAYPSLRRRSE